LGTGATPAKIMTFYNKRFQWNQYKRNPFKRRYKWLYEDLQSDFSEEDLIAWIYEENCGLFSTGTSAKENVSRRFVVLNMGHLCAKQIKILDSV
jgi:hypothetical protein